MLLVLVLSSLGCQRTRRSWVKKAMLATIRKCSKSFGLNKQVGVVLNQCIVFVSFVVVVE